MLASCVAGSACLSRGAVRSSFATSSKLGTADSPCRAGANKVLLRSRFLGSRPRSSASPLPPPFVRWVRSPGVTCSAAQGPSSPSGGEAEWSKEVVVEGDTIKEVLTASGSAIGGASAEGWSKEVVVQGDSIKEVLKPAEKPPVQRTGEAVQGAANTVGEVAGEAAENVGDAAAEAGARIGGAVEDAQETAADVGEEVVNQAAEVGETVVEQAQETGEVVAEQVQRVGENVAEAGGEAAEALGDAAEDLQERAESTLENVQEVAEETFEEAQERADNLQRNLEIEARKAASRAERVGRKLAEENERYQGRMLGAVEGLVTQTQQTGNVLGALTKAAGESFEAADDLRKGVTEAVTEAIQGVPVPADTLVDSAPPQFEFQPAESGPYKGIKAMVAGANGRTGQLLVETLVSKGVPVRALVRDVSKARALQAMKGVTVVQGDIYRYDTLQRAIGESNVVLCATGVRPDVLDPLGPFKYEYEGVVNLVALAKNQGVKKFVLVTSIGTSQLVNPFNLFYGLLWWKKQAEQALQRSGLKYTIVRPGGLTSTSKRANVVFRQADTTFGGSISRAQVAEACVYALVLPEADNKIVEIVAEENAAERSMFDLFSSI